MSGSLWRSKLQQGDAGAQSEAGENTLKGFILPLILMFKLFHSFKNYCIAPS